MKRIKTELQNSLPGMYTSQRIKPETLRLYAMPKIKRLNVILSDEKKVDFSVLMVFG